MSYNKMVSVTGLGGLYELVSSKSDGGIVRSLEDKSTKFVSNRVHNFSHLESIEVYTTGENVNLVEVFTAMQASKEALPDAKADAKAIKAYFEKVFPAMDMERVYGSDMKKMIRWYDILSKAGVEIKLSEASEEETGADQPAQAEKKTAKVVAPKAAAPKNNAPAKKINSPRKMA
jgi:DNA repair ATPase RecN